MAADLTLSAAVGVTVSATVDPQPGPAAAPPLPKDLLAVAFSLQELPRFEIPPLPRRSATPRWGDGGQQPAAGG